MRRLLLALLAACLLTGCTTLRKQEPGRWMDFVAAERDLGPTATAPPYDAERVASDYQTLMSLTRELDDLAGDMAALKRAFVFRDTPYLSDEENKQVEFLLFRFVNARMALWEMLSFYRQSQATDPDTLTRGSILGLSAGMNLMHYGSRFVALFLGESDAIKLFNAAHPRYEIAGRTYDTLADSVTAIEHLELVDVAWYLFCKALADPASRLSAIRVRDPDFAGLITRMDDLHAGIQIQTGYILHATRNPIPELMNRLEHSRIVRIGDQVAEDMQDGLYRIRGAVFKDVARMKNPGSRILRFTDAQVNEIRGLLQPGDLLFTYTSGYMSNVFLPGAFKHGITYLGTVEERREAGLTAEAIADHAVSPRQRRALAKHINRAPADGHPPLDVVEAVAEGVVIHSLEEILATHVNRLAVIRPRISPQERVRQLIALLQYVGAAYDFKFDFEDDTYQCCTELIYRTTNNLGLIDYSLVKTKGLWVLAADDILRYFLAGNPDAFAFVVLAEQHPDHDDMRAVLRRGPDGLQRLHQLLDLAPPEAAPRRPHDGF